MEYVTRLFYIFMLIWPTVSMYAFDYNSNERLTDDVFLLSWRMLQEMAQDNPHETESVCHFMQWLLENKISFSPHEGQPTDQSNVYSQRVQESTEFDSSQFEAVVPDWSSYTNLIDGWTDKPNQSCAACYKLGYKRQKYFHQGNLYKHMVRAEHYLCAYCGQRFMQESDIQQVKTQQRINELCYPHLSRYDKKIFNCSSIIRSAYDGHKLFCNKYNNK